MDKQLFEVNSISKTMENQLTTASLQPEHNDVEVVSNELIKNPETNYFIQPKPLVKIVARIKS